jgi:hypothetical protein
MCPSDMYTLVSVETLVSILQYQLMFPMKEHVICLRVSLLLTKNMLLEISSPVNEYSRSKEMKHHKINF